MGVYTLLPVILVRLASLVLDEFSIHVGAPVISVSFVPIRLLLHPAPTLPPHPSRLPCQHTPPPVKDLASDFPEKVRVTDEQTSRPGASEPVLISSSCDSGEVSSLLKRSLYISKPFISCHSCIFILQHFLSSTSIPCRYALVSLNLCNREVRNTGRFHRELTVWFHVRELIETLGPVFLSSLGLRSRHSFAYFNSPFLSLIYLVTATKVFCFVF